MTCAGVRRHGVAVAIALPRDPFPALRRHRLEATQRLDDAGGLLRELALDWRTPLRVVRNDCMTYSL
jgi:hypothetical protein